MKNLKNVVVTNTYWGMTKDYLQKTVRPILKNANKIVFFPGCYSVDRMIDSLKFLLSSDIVNAHITCVYSTHFQYDERMEIFYAQEYVTLPERLLFNPQDEAKKKEIEELLILLSERNIISIKFLFYKDLLIDDDVIIKGILVHDECSNGIYLDGWNAENAFINVNAVASWGEDSTRFAEIQSQFLSITSNRNVYLQTVEVREKFCKTEFESVVEHNGNNSNKEITLFDYQEEALQAWQNHNFRGILSMATGVGKTITSIFGISRLRHIKQNKLAVVILCPYQHLVEQWVSEVMRFGIIPIVGYSAPKYAGYEKKLQTKIINYNRRKEDFFCFITTNATFASEKIQRLINQVEKNVLLIADEAHYLGSESYKTILTDRFDYRLALSATINRHWDAEGTSFLYRYFGGIAYEFTIERAILENRLTPYKYYPVFTTLTKPEYSKYVEISKEISRNVFFDESGKPIITEKVKFLLMERAKVVAASVTKVDALLSKISNYANDTHMLVYCGAANMLAQEKTDGLSVREISYVLGKLKSNLGIEARQFTAEENAETRKLLLKDFKDGSSLQSLVAIRCLDEGVDIPSIKTAFILASSTNEKEYIQRRGRLLRRCPGKDYAEIYDFISLPKEAIGSFINMESYDKSLVNREMTRVLEYNRLAMNATDNKDTLDEICMKYHYSGEVEDELF